MIETSTHHQQGIFYARNPVIVEWLYHHGLILSITRGENKPLSQKWSKVIYKNNTHLDPLAPPLKPMLGISCLYHFPFINPWRLAAKRTCFSK